MKPEERIVKLEHELKRFRTLTGLFGVIGGTWLGITTVIAIVGLSPGRKPEPVQPAPIVLPAHQIAMGSDVTFGTLRCERLEVGDVGFGTEPQEPLFIVDDIGGGDAIRVLMQNRKKTSLGLIDVWETATLFALESEGRSVQIENDHIALYDDVRSEKVGKTVTRNSVTLATLPTGDGSIETRNGGGVITTIIGTDTLNGVGGRVLVTAGGGEGMSKTVRAEPKN